MQKGIWEVFYSSRIGMGEEAEGERGAMVTRGG